MVRLTNYKIGKLILLDLEESLRCLQWHMWFRWREESQVSGSMELTATELDYLYLVIGSTETLRLSDIAKLMLVSKASASAMIQKLHSRGYLHKTVDTNDGRSVFITATNKCSALIKEEKSIYAETALRMSQSLTPTELVELDRLLVKVRKNLQSE